MNAYIPNKKELLIQIVLDELSYLDMIIFDIHDLDYDEKKNINASEKAISMTIDYAVKTQDITEDEGKYIKRIFYDKYNIPFNL